MQQSISSNPSETPTPTDPAAKALRLPTVTGNSWPRKCACGCDQ